MPFDVEIISPARIWQASAGRIILTEPGIGFRIAEN